MTVSDLALPLQSESGRDQGAASCVLCGGELTTTIRGLFDTRFGIPGTYDVGVCHSCGLEQLLPRPASDELKSLYEQYYNFNGEKGTSYTKLRQCLFSSFLYRVWSLLDGDISFHNVRGSGRLLDIGCNEGRGLEIYSRNGFTPEGLELNENAAAIARERGFPVYTELLEHFYPDQLYDVVVLSNVLEHSLNPRAMLLDAARLLKPQGQIRISCPNARSWSRSIFSAFWINWHVPFHIVFFSPLTLRRLLQETGFGEIVLRQITPGLWLSSSIIARVFARRGNMTPQLRSAWLVPGLVLLTRAILFPFICLGNQLGRGDCLIVTATR
jgi:2-polyprenyl-3-methyl-5-hydroxy-6-metoxy-1,4-benzoquinol methylase